jgi:hypothetical protein
MMETICFSETLASTYESIGRHNPKERHRHLHRRESLKSQTVPRSTGRKETVLIHVKVGLV